MHTLQQLLSGELKGITRLRLSCGLKEVPVQVYELADTLEILDLSGNEISALSPEFALLTKLRIVFFSDNAFVQFPAVLAQCPELSMVGFKSNKISFIPEDALPLKLRWLILTNNQLSHLPASIGKCVYLQKVMFAGNKLQGLPKEMKACIRIELLRISANAMTALPDWLLSLPRLSWLAYSGNPFSMSPEVHPPDRISWGELELKEELGEGASGVISKAKWKNTKDIAVKVFKGQVTSDGLPSDEMKSCMAAGVHPNLVRVLAEMHHHPMHKQGLVLDLIPPSFKNLGGPPDLQTCTRDTFSADRVFTLEEVFSIVSGIASVTAHLHARGIMHGDLYAHNILINERAHALLSDFGAATFYDPTSSVGFYIERLEVRAFGCLLEDLLLRLDSIEQRELVSTFMKLKEACMSEFIDQRPDFKDILVSINTLQRLNTDK